MEQDCWISCTEIDFQAHKATRPRCLLRSEEEFSCAGRCSGSAMETRLESIMSEEGIAMEALLGGDGIADRPWRLNVSSFRLRDHLPNTTVDCAKKFGTFVFLFR